MTSRSTCEPNEGVEHLLDSLVRPVEDFPVDGVTFRDITPLLGDNEAFAQVIDALAGTVADLGRIDRVAGIESRGFLFGIALAQKLEVGFVPIRKAGKLPAEVYRASYDLEYGQATLEIHVDAIEAGDRVLVIDDVLATGGTLGAGRELLAAAGADIVAHLVVIELAALGGREALGMAVPIRSLQVI